MVAKVGEQHGTAFGELEGRGAEVGARAEEAMQQQEWTRRARVGRKVRLEEGLLVLGARVAVASENTAVTTLDVRRYFAGGDDGVVTTAAGSVFECVGERRLSVF